VIALALSPLSDWETFYVIVGSSAAALTGLNFVVIALGAERKSLAGGAEIAAFGTPTMVHFCAVLLLAAIVSAPWHALSSAGRGVVAAGAGGLAYSLLVVRHQRRQTGYDPVLEDWIWHTVLPLIAYAILLIAGLVFGRNPERALFAVGTAALLLLYIGIHNAWDSATYIATRRPKTLEGGDPGANRPAP
jgi:hypothetical protein